MSGPRSTNIDAAADSDDEVEGIPSILKILRDAVSEYLQADLIGTQMPNRAKCNPARRNGVRTEADARSRSRMYPLPCWQSSILQHF